MEIFFWDFTDKDNRIRQWAMFILNILVCLYTCFALYKTSKHYKRCIFQLMPLSINVAAAFILLFLKLFEKGYQFDQVSHLVQIFTYFLFCYTFALMYTKATRPIKHKLIQKIWNIILIVAFALLIVAVALVFIGTIDKNCGTSQGEKWATIINIALQAITFIPTAYYGIMILKVLKSQHHQPPSYQNLQQSGISTKIQTFSKDFYLKQRKNQIHLVLGVYALSLFVRAAMAIIFLTQNKNIFQCDQYENSNVFILTSKHWYGQAILIMIQINQLLPQIVIPFAMYIVPLRKTRRTKSIKFQSGFVQDQLDQDSGKQADLDERITSMITSKLSGKGSPNRKRASSYY